MKKKLIITKNLISCAQRHVRLEQCPTGILICGENIEKVAPQKEFQKELEDSGIEKIDGGEGYVLPGLIDGHLHLSFSASSQPVTELVNDTPSRILLREAAAAQTELKSGVTGRGDPGAGYYCLRNACYHNRRTLQFLRVGSRQQRRGGKGSPFSLKKRSGLY